MKQYKNFVAFTGDNTETYFHFLYYHQFTGDNIEGGSRFPSSPIISFPYTNGDQWNLNS